MEHTLKWLSEEEGYLLFSEGGKTFLQADFFIAGEEAEWKIQTVALPENKEEYQKIHHNIISKMTDCVMECFRLLWEEGFEETLLVESPGTEIAKILDSTGVVEKLYSEYMMQKYLKQQKTTACGQEFLKLTKQEEGYLCENREQTFFCRLLQHTSERDGENVFYLCEVEVAEEKRNQGIATECLEHLFRQLAEEKPATVLLQVGSYNEPAVHVYQKLGFTVSEELCYYAQA